MSAFLAVSRTQEAETTQGDQNLALATSLTSSCLRLCGKYCCGLCQVGVMVGGVLGTQLIPPGLILAY